jgi:polyisoprenoid-binding protein YceI
MNIDKDVRIWAAAFLFQTVLFAADKTIDVAKSLLTIHVGKTGAFSMAGHEHWIDAPIAHGQFSEGAAAKVEFAVDARKLKVRPGKEPAKDVPKVQEAMQSEVLESAKYPEILFRSTKVTSTGAQSWEVTGTLSLHGVSKPVAVRVRRQGDIYTGSARIKQTDFGIKPISAGGGAVKVKDELEITFQIHAR